MRRVVRVIVASVAVAVSPQLARADGPPPVSIKVFCQPGSLNNCFAFGFESADGRVTYWLQNLQGSIADAGAAGAPFSINGITIQNSGTEGNPSLRYRELLPNGTPIPDVCRLPTPEGAVQTGNNCYNIDSFAGASLQRRYVSFGPGVLGCDTFGPPGLDFYVAQTCLPRGLDGWLRFDASLSVVNGAQQFVRPGTIEDLFVNVVGCNVYVGATSGFSGAPDNCATNLAYADIASRYATVIPEPTSLALLASGLLGTGVVGVRARRKRV